MYIIRQKKPDQPEDIGIFMKTSIGLLPVGFEIEAHAMDFIRASGEKALFVSVSRDDLQARNPSALSGLEQVLVFPSLEVLRQFYQQGENFPISDYLVRLSHAT